MEKIDKNLILRAMPITLIFQIVFLYFAFDISYLILEIIDVSTHGAFDIPVSGIIPAGILFEIILIILNVVMSFYFFIRWYSNYYILKDKTLEYNYGIILKQKKILNLTHIKFITTQTNTLGQIFDYGDIQIHYFDTKDVQLLHNISQPDFIVELLEKRINK